MNNQINNKKKVISRMMDVLKKSKVSSDDYNTSNQPFFLREDQSSEFKIDFNVIENVPEGLNRNVKLMYDILGTSKKEIYINNWTIMSLDQAMEVYNEYCKNGREDVFDIGYVYLGMGHIGIIACDLNTHLLYYHRGGGSNGYDREENFQEVIKNGPKEKQIYFTKWFYEDINADPFLIFE